MVRRVGQLYFQTPPRAQLLFTLTRELGDAGGAIGGDGEIGAQEQRDRQPGAEHACFLERP
jgi:hypothetical protein